MHTTRIEYGTETAVVYVAYCIIEVDSRLIEAMGAVIAQVGY